jgi:hypothetical protein
MMTSSLLPLAQNSAAEFHESALLAVFTDYENICAPYVPAVREVLEGKKSRFKLHYNNATFVFHHGCLMVQIVHEGLIRALPPFGIGMDGKPYLQVMPEHQKHWMTEFLTLPKSILLFYFSLLKQVFGNHPLQGRWQDPLTNRISLVPVPVELRSILNEVDWAAR